MTAEKKHPNPEKQDRRSPAEWVTLAISSALLAFVVGVIIYSSIAGVGPHAILHVRTMPEQAWRQDGRYYLPVEVHNVGGDTAASVVVAIGTPEKPDLAHFTIRYLAGDERARGVGVLDAAWADAQVQAHVTSFVMP